MVIFFLGHCITEIISKRGPYDALANELDSDIKASLNSNRAIPSTFGIIPLGKA